jgi:hypothetical protein
MKNDIIKEVWHNRDQFAKEHNYDLNAMVATLQKMEKHPLSKTVDRSKIFSAKNIGHRQILQKRQKSRKSHRIA